MAKMSGRLIEDKSAFGTGFRLEFAAGLLVQHDTRQSADEDRPLIRTDFFTAAKAHDIGRGNQPQRSTDIGNLHDAVHWKAVVPGVLQPNTAAADSQQIVSGTSGIVPSVPVQSVAVFDFDTGKLIYGGPDADTLSGGPLNDTIQAFSGDDLIFCVAGDDFVSAWVGNDTVYGGDGNDTIYGGKGRDQIWGDGGDDELNGQEGGDRVFGDLGNDTIWGELGNDTLWGGQGIDVLYGGSGADMFLFNNANESGRTFVTMDRIEDYEDGIDKLNLGLIDANANRSGNQTFRLSATGEFDGEAGSLRVLARNGDTYVMADFNGDMLSDFSIKLEGMHSLAALDFIL